MAKDRTITIENDFCVSLGIIAKTIGTSRRNITHLTTIGFPFYWQNKQKTFPLVKCMLWIIKNHSLKYRKDLSPIGLEIMKLQHSCQTVKVIPIHATQS